MERAEDRQGRVRGARQNAVCPPIRTVTGTVHEPRRDLDVLDCGHTIEAVYRDGKHILRRKCAACPPGLVGERADRVRS